MKKEEFKKIVEKKAGDLRFVKVEIELDKLKEIDNAEYQRWIQRISEFKQLEDSGEEFKKNGKIMYKFNLNASCIESCLTYYQKMIQSGGMKFWNYLDDGELDMYAQILNQTENLYD